MSVRAATWRGLEEEDVLFFVSHVHAFLCSSSRSGQYATGGDSGESTIVDYCPELYVIASVHVMFTECNLSVDGGHKDIALCCNYVVTVVMTLGCCLLMWIVFWLWFVVVLCALQSCPFVCRPWPMMMTCEAMSSDLN